MLRVNSKKVMPGDTFLALKGKYKDGHDYIEEAINKGAMCIIANHGEYSVKTVLVDDTRTYLSNYLKELYMQKLEKIKLIGIAGTNGKTITGNLIYQLLNNLNMKTAYIGTNGFHLNGKTRKLPSTTPDIYELYELINEAIDNECEVIIIETSSNAIKQRHIEGIRFDMAVFTNFIAHDRKDKEEYLNTKIELFKMIKKGGIAIINKKDPYYNYFTLPQNNNIFYGPLDSTYPIRKIETNYDYTEFTINQTKIKMPLIGPYSMYGYAPAYIIAQNLYFEDEAIKSATLSLKPVDGRFEPIKYKDNLIVIDYAYDLTNIIDVLKETRKLSPNKIITVVGCGGERRKNQRPLIGKSATQYSDKVIFTSDNSRNENNEDIVKDIVNELSADNYEIILDRKEAIKKGISLLENNDILLILGKGHEDVQIIGSDEIPFKDYNEVMKIVK